LKISLKFLGEFTPLVFKSKFKIRKCKNINKSKFKIRKCKNIEAWKQVRYSYKECIHGMLAPFQKLIFCYRL